MIRVVTAGVVAVILGLLFGTFVHIRPRSDLGMKDTPLAIVAGRPQVADQHPVPVPTPVPTTATPSASHDVSLERKIPSDVKKTGDEFIINLVGWSEFNRNYRLDYERSADCTSRDPGFSGCSLAYRFLPGDLYGGSTYLFHYSPRRKEIFIGTSQPLVNLPSCERDRNHCNFLISLDALKDIARRSGLLDDTYTSFRLVMHSDRVVVEISYCNLENSGNRRAILVDPVNGNIVWHGENKQCQGIV